MSTYISCVDLWATMACVLSDWLDITELVKDVFVFREALGSCTLPAR